MLVQALLLLPLIGSGLHVLGLRRLQALLSCWPLKKPGSVPAEKISHIAERQAHFIQIAARQGPYRPTCLRQSLALWWFLRRRGIDTKLRIGVKPGDSGLEAHAWVELHGQPLNDAICQHFSPFDPAIIP